MNIFGEWETLGDFTTNKPFPHVVIRNFFTDTAFQHVLEEFGNPYDDNHWVKYWNPLEKKYALNNFSGKPFLTDVFEQIQTAKFIDMLKTITGISYLVKDEHMHGAGIHYHPRNGKLDMHLDYSIHPLSGLERKLNLIVYLNEDWQEDWGGALELWDKDFTHCETAIYPHRNTAVLFQTSDISYHGIPHPITCPDTSARRSLAVYYMTEPDASTVVRHKAEFRPLPGQQVSDSLQRLFDIRKTRNITDKDLQGLAHDEL